jgi:hypothetical protein
MAAWIDGALYLHVTGFDFRTTEALKIKRISLGIYIHNNEKDNTAWHDNVALSTGYIGTTDHSSAAPARPYPHKPELQICKVSPFSIFFTTQKNATFTLSLYSLSGRRLWSFHREYLQKGNHKISLSDHKVTRGIYILKTTIHDISTINLLDN